MSLSSLQASLRNLSALEFIYFGQHKNGITCRVDADNLNVSNWDQIQFTPSYHVYSPIMSFQHSSKIATKIYPLPFFMANIIEHLYMKDYVYLILEK